MNSWRPVPLLRLVIPFIAGIILGQVFNPSLPVYVLPSVILAFCLELFLFQFLTLSYRLRWMTGLSITFAFLLSGFQYANTGFNDRHRPEADFYKPVVLLARVSECPIIKKTGLTAVADAVSIYDSGAWKPLRTKIFIKVYGSQETPVLSYGSYFIVHGRPEKLVFFAARHLFNFRSYLYDKGIRFEMGCKKTDCYEIPGGNVSSISRLAFRARDKLLRIFREKGLSGQEFSVAAALLLGYVNEIDSHLKSAFASSGTMHILSVSGMHVGIIFLFLETALSFLSKFRHGIWFKSLIQLLFIASYAAITGFSPAVLRAATCLGFMIIGKTIRRKPEMLNVISASVFFLLVMDTSILSDVGFQLSYLAVIGIVILNKPIYDLYVTHHWLPDKIWALVAVSMAAQIATFPLSLYYFHRFPNYFILSNLVIVPLSNGIILMGILGLVFSPLPIVGNLTISALKLLLKGLNHSVLFIGSLPGAVSSGFFPTVVEVCLLYLLISFIFLFLSRRQPVFLMPALCCLIMLEVQVMTGKLSSSARNGLAVHQGSQGYVIRYMRGRDEACFYSGLRMLKDPFIADQIGNEQMAAKVNSVQQRWVNFRGWQKAAGFPELGRFGNMIIANHRRLYILDSPISKNFHLRIHADILLISRPASYNLDRLKNVFSPEIILNASTASHSKIIDWSDQARRLGIKFYDLKSSGFYQEE